MHLHFEKNPDTKCDCSILSLSWMGKVPDNIPADEGWKLSRINYYQEGWLATGNMRGTVGVTFTSSNYKKNAAAEFPQRTNFNLRGHRSEVILVKWNEPYQKLASCDSTGIIFVWIKYEGRWSIELINDRNCPVTHFSWSHDGRMALICYQDGFVLVGSVSGQRYWSSMLNLESTITCGIWTPDDQQVYFGTTQGQIIVMDVHGAMVSQVQVCSDAGICAMSWSCEKFKMEEDEEMEPGVANANKRSFVLAVSFTNGFIYLMKSFDDLAPMHINTELNGKLGFHMEWSNSRELLAVAGTAATVPATLSKGPKKITVTVCVEPTVPDGCNITLTPPTASASSSTSSTHSATTDNHQHIHNQQQQHHQHNVHNANASTIYQNMLKFYTQSGQLLFAVNIPNGSSPGSISSPVSALTWGHSDKRLFVATGAQIHIAWMSRRVASLQLMCRLQVQRCIGPENALSILPLPSKIKSLIGHLYAQTIRVRCSVPNAQSLRDFVSRPPAGSRLHCTMIRHDDEQNASTGVCYTLYLEYLGGLVPLLKGKRTSKIRPEFVIFDPQSEESTHLATAHRNGAGGGDKHSSHSSTGTVSSSNKTDTSDSEADAEFGKGSPRSRRKRKTRTSKCRHYTFSNNNNNNNTNNGANGTNITNNSCNSCVADTRTTSLQAQADVDDELAYVDTLPEDVKLVEVNSNIWGTKFKIHGIAKNLPANLGQISYKTSLLHLQPRQMTVIVTELRDDLRHEPDPNFNPHIFSEDEDETLIPATTSASASRAIRSPSPLLSSPSSSGTSSAPEAVRSAARDRDESVGMQLPLPVASLLMGTPRPNRLVSRSNAATFGLGGKNGGGILLGPLARAESYDDDSVSSDVVEPAAAMPTPLAVSKPSTSSMGNNAGVSRPSCYSSLVTQYSRSSSNSSGQSSSRHAISPLCSDGSVPTLQSPKNAVAPSDIIFDRPPPTGLHSLSGCSNSGIGGGVNDCSVVKVKTESSKHQHHHQHHCIPGPSTSASPSTSTARQLNKDDTTSAVCSSASTSATETTAVVVEPIMHRTPTIVSIAPTAIVRSCSVGYLDSVNIIPSDVSLSLLRKEAPNKRLVLIDQKPSTSSVATVSGCANRNKAMVAPQRRPQKKKFLVECGKSKSFDSCDLQRVLAARIPQTVGDTEKQSPMPQLHETSETEDSASDNECIASDVVSGSQPPPESDPVSIAGAAIGNDREVLIITTPGTSDRSLSSSRQALLTPTTPPPSSQRAQPFCFKCKIMSRECQCKQTRKPSGNDLKNLAVRAKKEAITSFADSPLFTRKHRFGDSGSTGSAATAASPNLGKKHEFSFSFLKQLSEARRRKRDEQAGANREEREVQEQIDVDATSGGGGGNGRDDRGFASLQSQALSTLENIISRLKDLEDNSRANESASASAGPEVRLPRSSPSSPAPNKKKRNTSSSPIRQLLNSPLLNRRNRKKQQLIVESSDEETPLFSNVDDKQGLPGQAGGKKDKQPYQDLETFQKAQLRQKLKRGKIEPNGMPSVSQPVVLRREFVMHNKAPMWNENSQVYQLDFGGRVTQESAKNFQIEFRGQQVMQFGRIDGNAYTLDFQYPFSALQAFSVALANVTQRLK